MNTHIIYVDKCDIDDTLQLEMRELGKILFTVIAICGVFLGAWYVSEKFETNNDGLSSIYGEYIHPCMNYWTTDPHYSDTTSPQVIAMKMYDNGEYVLALEAFQRFEPNEQDEAQYHLYIGFCYLKADFDQLAIYNLNEAMTLFAKTKEKQMAKWYLALAQLKVGDQEQAVQNFQDLVEMNAPQKYKSKEILRQIEMTTSPLKGLIMVVSGK